MQEVWVSKWLFGKNLDCVRFLFVTDTSYDKMEGVIMNDETTLVHFSVLATDWRLVKTNRGSIVVLIGKIINPLTAKFSIYWWFSINRWRNWQLGDFCTAFVKRLKPWGKLPFNYGVRGVLFVCHFSGTDEWSASVSEKRTKWGGARRGVRETGTDILHMQWDGREWSELEAFWFIIPVDQIFVHSVMSSHLLLLLLSLCCARLRSSTVVLAVCRDQTAKRGNSSQSQSPECAIMKSLRLGRIL